MQQQNKLVYKHDFEDLGLCNEDQIILERVIVDLFPSRSCLRVLFVAVPQVSNNVFEYDAARKGKYPCFPPYGPGILIKILEGIEKLSITADVIDLHYVILNAAHLVPEEQFDIAVWKTELMNSVVSFKPDLIGLSCMFNLGHSWLKSVATFLKDAFPDLPLSAGGVHPTLTVDQVLKDVPSIDLIFLYEADKSFPDFLQFVNGLSDGSRLSQIACRDDDGRVIKLTRRNLPEVLEYSPEYKSLPISSYSQVGKIGAYTFLRDSSAVAATVLSARGCRAQCGFCSVRSVNGIGVRVRDVDAVVDEVERLSLVYGVQHIMWLDDDLFYNSRRALSLFSALADRSLGVTWDASNGVIAASLTEDLLSACVRSGCVGLGIGIESGNPEMLRAAKKPGTVGTFKKAAVLLNAAPQIFTKGLLMIGFPGETIAMLHDTVNLAVTMGLDWFPIQVLTPMPGTPIFKMMEDQGLLGDIPTTVLDKARTFSVGAVGGIQKRERMEKVEALPFSNLLEGDSTRVPDRAEMEDLWFIIDYKINYEPILTLVDRHKLEKKHIMLAEICRRMTTDNALGLLFLGILSLKLEKRVEASRLLLEARRCCSESKFWQFRFKALGIENYLADLSMEYTE